MQLSRNTVLFFCAAVVTITSISMHSFSLFLKPIEAGFGWSRTMVTVPYMFAMLGWGVGAVLFGKLADDLGARRVILGGILLMAGGFFGMSLSQNLWQLSLSFGAMVGLAMGACGLVTISLLVSKHYDAKHRGLAVSVIQTAAPLSPLLFTPALYFLIETFDWRAAALATGVLLVTVALPLAWLGARDPDDGLTSRHNRAGWGSCIPYLRNRSMLLMFAARFSCGVAFFQSAHLVTFALSKGFDQATGAVALGVFGGAAAVSALLFGWLSDHYGRVRVLALSYLVRGLALWSWSSICRTSCSSTSSWRWLSAQPWHNHRPKRALLRDCRTENGGAHPGLELYCAPDRLCRRTHACEHRFRHDRELRWIYVGNGRDSVSLCRPHP